MISRISIITFTAIIGTTISLAAQAFSFGSGSSNPRFSERGMRPMPGFNQRSYSGIRVEKGMDEKGYYLTIHMGGMAPEDLIIKPMNGSLVISSSHLSQTETRDQTPGRSYRFSRSFGSFNRRISLPFDADTENMERNDSDDVVTLFMPRLVNPGQQYGFGPGYAPQPGQLPGPNFNQSSGPSLSPNSDLDDLSQYPIPDQTPPASDKSPAAAPYGAGEDHSFQGGYMAGPGFDPGYRGGYPQQPGFTPPIGYGAYEFNRTPYGQNLPPPLPGQMPYAGEILPADSSYQTGNCNCPCPCPENRSSMENRE